MDYDTELTRAREEFKTSREAERMVKDLYAASIYCIGPNSSVAHGNRIAAVKAVAQELRENGK